MRDFARPRYFSPFEAVGYGLIDQVRGDAPRGGGGRAET